MIALQNNFHPTKDFFLILGIHWLNKVINLTKENCLINQKLNGLYQPNKQAGMTKMHSLRSTCKLSKFMTTSLTKAETPKYIVEMFDDHFSSSFLTKTLSFLSIQFLLIIPALFTIEFLKALISKLILQYNRSSLLGLLPSPHSSYA